MFRRVVGNSMFPALHEGEYVFGVRTKKIAIGDIVIAPQNDREVIKRISAIDEQYVWLKGDNTAQSIDSSTLGPVLKKDVKAKIVWPRTF